MCLHNSQVSWLGFVSLAVRHSPFTSWHNIYQLKLNLAFMPQDQILHHRPIKTIISPLVQSLNEAPASASCMKIVVSENHSLLGSLCYVAGHSTCIFAGELGLGVTHPFGSLTVFLVAPILAVLVSVTSPALWDAGSICDTVELLLAALNHRWQHWNKSHLTITASQITLSRAQAQHYQTTSLQDIFNCLHIFISADRTLRSHNRSVRSRVISLLCLCLFESLHSLYLSPLKIQNHKMTVNKNIC